MHRQFQGANRDCPTCNRRLLGEFSGRDIPWGNAVYRVREFLGGGGMGEVYRAIEQDHANTFSRECAIKFNKNMMDPDVGKRFQLEVRILNMLQNPHNIRVYNYGELYEERATGMDIRAQFMVMELLEGQPLNEIVKQGPMPAHEAVPIFVQVCSALSEAHQRDIIHRDLKPHNIMLQNVVGDRFAKVFDFGLSKLTNNMDDRLSTTGVVMGTFRYMSPEQALGETLDRRTDIFSLGVVLYEVLEGQHPFPAKNLFELFTLHQNGPPPMQRISVELQAIVLKSLAYEQEKRYQSVDELRADLQLWLGDSLSGAGVHASQILALREWMAEREANASGSHARNTPASDSSSENKQGLWIALFSVLILAVGAGGFFIYGLLRTSPSPQKPDHDRPNAANSNDVRKLGQIQPQDNRPIPTERRDVVEQRQPSQSTGAVRYVAPEARTSPQVPVVRRTSPRRYQKPRRYRRRAPSVQRVVVEHRTPEYRPPPPPRREITPPPPQPRTVRVAMIERPAPRRIVEPPKPRCPSTSPPVRYGQLDRALGKGLNTRVSQNINKAAVETIYDEGLRLSQSWKQSPVICKRSYLRERILSIVENFCRGYRPASGCPIYRAKMISRGERTLFVCQRS